MNNNEIKVGDKVKVKLDHLYHPNKRGIVTYIGDGDGQGIAMIMDSENENIRVAIRIKDLESIK